jgi:type IV pilus assembly protein PilQ
MKKIIFMKIFLLVFLIILAGCATTPGVQESAVEEDLPVVTDIHLEDNKVVIRSNRAFTYTVYSTDDPYRTIVEIPDLSLGEHSIKVYSNYAGISEIVPEQLESPRFAAKFDVVLKKPSAVVPVYRDRSLTLMVKAKEPLPGDEESVSVTEVEGKAEGEAPSMPEYAVSPYAALPETDISSLPEASEITNIEITREADSVKVIIEGDGTMMPNVFPLDDRIVIDIPDVTMVAALPDSVISPMRGIRAGKHRDKVRLVVDLMEETNFDVTAIGKTITVSLLGEQAAVPGQPFEGAEGDAPPTPMAGAIVEGKCRRYIDGTEKVSFDFQDQDILPILRLLADISGCNIVIHPDVKGKKFTMKLINVPWNQALDILLRTFALSKIVDGNVIRIVPTTVVAKEMQDIAKKKKAETEAGELKTRIFPVNYADLTKLKDAIDKAKVLSSRGSMTLDERGSSLIVNDIEANLDKTGDLISEIDQEHMQARQVMIEAKIVEVTTDYTKELGIQWGGQYTIPTARDSFAVGGTTLTEGEGPGGSYLVNLPAAVTTGAGGAIGFGYINRAANLALDVQLSAMEENRKGKVLSNPRIMTMNNEEATITQGRTIYIPIATSDKTDLKAIDALLSLKVRPRIAPGGAIFMRLNISKDEPGTATAGGVDVLKNTINTNVLVNNGDTVVIGGIFKTSKTEQESGVPLLSNVPLLGYLFKKDQNVIADTEVLIFITPKIVEFAQLK